MSTDNPSPTIKDVLAPLESALIDEFLRQSGCDPATVGDLQVEERERLMKAASAYASGKLAEVEARAHFVRDIHGDAEDSDRTRHR